MTYPEFIETITETFRQMMSSDTNISIHQVIKNNDIQLDALTILPKGQIITPSIYLNNFYQELLTGRPLAAIIEEIHQLYQENQLPSSIHPENLLDFELAKQQIAYKLINYQNNQKLLSDVPHIAYLDLAIVFYLLIDKDYLGQSTALIHHKHMQMWKIDLDTLYQLAKENTPKLLAYEFTSMNNLMSSLLNDCMRQEHSSEINYLEIKELLEQLSREKEQMYVLSNQSKHYGAAVLLYENILEEIANTLDNDFFILPSSVHEVIILPYTDTLEQEELQHMVREINLSDVDEMERLSNHVYIYSRNTQTIQF